MILRLINNNKRLIRGSNNSRNIEKCSTLAITHA